MLLLTGTVFFAGCSDKEKQAAIHARQIVPEEVLGIESLLSEPYTDSTGKLSAKVKGKLTAPFMLRYPRADTPYAEFPRTLHVDFYDATMAVESQMDALYGKYFDNQGKVFLRDSVVVKNIQKGDTVRCKELWWDQRSEKFTTDDSVRIYTKDKILFGNGMEADQNFRWYTIKHLTGTILTAGNNIPK
ncbi:MAG TPA: LPS export ABC transporter periplasmic protein LptC [Puia sp.]|nr:LPS export ABC transporter periplasmic protein LptC [Puia sp.]